jgi:phage terminase large subunit
MADIEITMPANGWLPRRHQLAFFRALDAGVKRHVLVWHRRAGKDSCAINWAASEMADRPTSVLHLLPELTQAKRVLWREVDKETGLTHIKQAFPEPLLQQVNESEGFLRLKNGSIYQVGGFDRIDSYVGIGPQVVIMSEYAISPHAERAWNLLTPILRANDGVAIFAFTPRGHNHGKALFDAASKAEGWFVSRLSIDDTGLVPVEAIKADIDAGLVDEETARQEWWVSWEAPNTGSYYGRAIEKLEAAGQVTDLAWEPSMPVYTAWDIGVSDATAIWFFQPYKTGWVNVIDYHEGEGEGLPHYLSLLNDRKAAGWTFDPRGQLVPHDFAARDFTSGEAPTQAAQRLGWRMTVVPLHDREHGIDAVRRLLPKCRFDRTRCAKGLERLKLYRKQWSKQLQVFTGPLHDVNSNGSDAFRYLAMGLRQAGFQTASSARVAEIQARDERPFAQAGVVVARTDWSAFDPGSDDRREERSPPYDLWSEFA